MEIRCRLFPLSAWVVAMLAHPFLAQPGESPCRVVGQLSGQDRTARTLTVKTDNGDLIDIHYDGSSEFVRRPGTAAPVANRSSLEATDLNRGDRICVEQVQAGGIANRIAVSPRFEIRAKQQDDLREWSMHGVFGKVRLLDSRTRRMTIETQENGISKELVVAAGTKTTYWAFPPGGGTAGPAGDTTPRVAVASSWDELGVGDFVYAYGTPELDGTSELNLVIRGGVRVFVGAIESLDGLHERVALRTLPFGEKQIVHTDLSRLYLIGRSKAVENPDGRKLYWMPLADLARGDAVIVVGREDRDHSIEGLAIVSGFLVSGDLTNGQGVAPDWIFRQLGIGPVPR